MMIPRTMIPTTIPVFEVISAGLSSSLQDRGRPFLKKWGIPPSGVMDQSAYRKLHALLDLPEQSAVVENMLGGLELRCLSDCWICHAGPGMVKHNGNVSTSLRTHQVAQNDRISVGHHAQGLWNYLAVEGGFAGDQWFGSRSIWPAGGMGHSLQVGDILSRYDLSSFPPHPSIKSRFLSNEPERLGPISVMRGPQWEDFPESSQSLFLESVWKVSAQSSRAGYRLDGPKLQVPVAQMLSEPTLLGSIQIPPNGQPIVLLNDGPTVGGYPKIAWITDANIDGFRQRSPGSTIEFSLIA